MRRRAERKFRKVQESCPDAAMSVSVEDGVFKATIGYSNENGDASVTTYKGKAAKRKGRGGLW